MRNTEDLILFGLILKTHGIEGHLVLKLYVLPENELKENEPVFIEIDGLPVPFFIREFRTLSDDSALFLTDSEYTPVPVSDLINCRVFVKSHLIAEQDGEKAVNYEDLTGFRVVDERHGDQGVVREIVEYSENTLMVVDFKDREILIPFHEDIVRYIDFENRLIEILAPEGLLDINL
jgi:16S rRNA processing protein RimM